jgi:predicted integral membrane protein DUF2269
VYLFLLVAHIGAAILFVGPATFASSAFARFASPSTREVAESLHAVTRSYGTATLIVPAVGIALAAQRALFTQGWLMAATGIFVVALGLLLGLVVPAQERALDVLQAGANIPASLRLRLRLGAGFFALCWVVVLALMVMKPF